MVDVRAMLGAWDNLRGAVTILCRAANMSTILPSGGKILQKGHKSKTDRIYHSFRGKVKKCITNRVRRNPPVL